MRVLYCQRCERITGFEEIEDSEVVDGTALRCRSCLTSLETAQTTLDVTGGSA